MSTALKSVERATLDNLWELYAKLERANLTLNATPENPRAATLQALRNVVEFLQAQPANWDGRLSRPLELLGEELSALGAAPAGMILPPYDGGSGGVNRRRIINLLKGEAAYAVELCVGAAQQETTRHEAALEVLTVLNRHGFPHGIRRGDKVAGYLRTIARYRDPEQDHSGAARRYRELVATPRDKAPPQYAVIGWLVERLERHGFIDGALSAAPSK